jgi:hypothetical protein
MQLYFLASALGTSGMPTPVLTIDSYLPAPGSPLQISSIDGAIALWQLWSFTSEGWLVSAYDSTLALSNGQDDALIVDTLQPGEATQIWQISNGTIVNQQTGQALTVAAPSNPYGSAAVLAPVQASSQAQQWMQTGFDCRTLLTTVVNGTTTDLLLSVTAIEGEIMAPDGTVPLPASASVTVASTYTDGLTTGFQIFDPNNAASSVASFEVHQHQCVLEAGDVWVDTINYLDGYTVSNVQTQGGSYHDKLPGNASVTITQS